MNYVSPTAKGRAVSKRVVVGLMGNRDGVTPLSPVHVPTSVIPLNEWEIMCLSLSLSQFDLEESRNEERFHWFPARLAVRTISGVDMNTRPADPQ